MNLPLSTLKNLQQRARTNNLTPAANATHDITGSGSKFSFQLSEFLGIDGKPDPGNYTVQFGLSDPNSGLLGGDFVRARAEIIWKQSGNDIRRVIDCNNGVSISGTAEGVSVLVFDDSNIAVTPANAIKAYQVSVQVAKGTRPSIQQPPTFTTDDFALAANSNNPVNIPANIGAISVFTAVSPDVIGNAVGAYDVLVTQESLHAERKQYDPRQSDWVPLIPGATIVRANSSAAAPITRWQFTFGIDG